MKNLTEKIFGMLKGQKGNKGFILITSYLLMMVMEIYSMALLTRNTSFYQATERNENKMISFNMAEAGLDRAIYELSKDLTYGGQTIYKEMNTSGMEGGYASTVSSTDENGAAFANTKMRMMRTVGHSPSLANGFSATSCPATSTGTRAYECREIISYVEYDDTLFEYAVFGDKNVKLNGASGVIDSYNSDNGNYGGGNVANNGDVAYDGTYTNNNTTVNGDLSTPNISCQSGTSTVASSGTLNITGSSTVTLGAGTYYYDSIKISGTGQLVTTGPVTIYVKGDVDISGKGVATSGNIPANLFLITTAKDTNVKVSGSSDFYGIIYAPGSTVTNDSGDFYGAVITDNFTQNGNGDVHYDESLADMPSPCVQVDLLSWRERNPAAA